MSRDAAAVVCKGEVITSMRLHKILRQASKDDYVHVCIAVLCNGKYAS